MTAPGTTNTQEPNAFMATFKGEGVDDALKARVVEQLKKCYDPEIPVDIYELGLVYDIEVAVDKSISVVMTLTSPNCPSAEQIPGDVEKRLREIEGVPGVKVAVTFEPPWTKEKMSPAALLELGFDG